MPDDRTPASVPLQLHTSAVALDGSPQWHPAFARWIGQLKPTSVILWHQWWRDYYVTDRLYARSFREPVLWSPDECHATLMWLWDEDWKALYPRVQPHRLERTRRRMRTFVRTYLYPYDRPRRVA